MRSISRGKWVDGFAYHREQSCLPITGSSRDRGLPITGSKAHTSLRIGHSVAVAAAVVQAGHVDGGVAAAVGAAAAAARGAAGPPPPHAVRHQLHHVAQRLACAAEQQYDVLGLALSGLNSLHGLPMGARVTCKLRSSSMEHE